MTWYAVLAHNIYVAALWADRERRFEAYRADHERARVRIRLGRGASQ